MLPDAAGSAVAVVADTVLGMDCCYHDILERKKEREREGERVR